MKIDDNTYGGGKTPPRTGLIPDALPEVQKPVLVENSQTGVSTRNALSRTDGAASGDSKLAVTLPRRIRAIGSTFDSTPPKTIKQKPKNIPHWYALRVTYGREKRGHLKKRVDSLLQ